MRLGLAAIVLCAWVSHARAQDSAEIAPSEDNLFAPEDPGPPPVAVSAELRGDGLYGLDASDGVLWMIPHLSLADPQAKPPPVVLARGNAFYAIRGDLLEADLTDGKVIGRTRFPAVIDDLKLAKDGAIDVRLRDSVRGGSSVDVIHYTPGKPAPGRGTVDPVPWAASQRDAGGMIPGWDAPKPFDVSKLSPETRDAALAALASAAERDPTNPHYRLFEGQLLRAAGRNGDALVAFTAATTTGSSTEMLHVWTKLEDLGEIASAERAYARYQELAKLEGVRADRQRGLITLVSYVPKVALAAAIEAGDVKRVDALSANVWRLAPHVEGGRWVWATLAAWFASRDAHELADTWRARAAEGGTLVGAPPDIDVDGWAARAAACLLAIPIVALLIGLRRGAAARTTPTPFPYLQLVDLAALLLPLIPVMYGRLQVIDAVSAVGRSASAPVALWSDAVDAESVTWVERKLPDSEARTEILTYLNAELDAMRAGGRSDAAPFDLDRTLPAAIAAKEPLGKRLRHLDDGLDELQGEQRVPTLTIPGALGLALVLFLSGYAIGRRRPGAAVLARIVPGGAGPLWAFGGLVTAALLCGVYHFAWDPWIGEIAIPSFDQMFGLGALPDLPAQARPTPWWPFAAIGGAVAAQAAAAWFELRR